MIRRKEKINVNIDRNTLRTLDVYLNDYEGLSRSAYLEILIRKAMEIQAEVLEILTHRKERKKRVDNQKVKE